MSTSNQAQLRASRPASVLDADTAPRSDDASGPWPAPAHTPTEMVPIEHEAPDRIVRTLVFVLPPAALGVGGWLAWGGTLHWQDLLVLAVTYTLTGLGITVGYHRLFTHRSFKTTRSVRVMLAVLGSMAVEGPVLEWVATHRKHHRFSDHPGDPHSPHVDHAPGLAGFAARTLACARRLDVAWQGHGEPGPLRQGPSRGSRPPLHQPGVPALGARRASRSVWARRGADRLYRGRPHRTSVGRSGADLPLASRDLQHQLVVPLLWPATVHHPRSVTQPRLACPAGVRRGLAQQPSRLPDVGATRAESMGGRPRGVAHCRARAHASRVGCGPDQPRSPASQTRKRGCRLAHETDRDPRSRLRAGLRAGDERQRPLQGAWRRVGPASPDTPSAAQRGGPVSVAVVRDRMDPLAGCMGPARRGALARPAVERAGDPFRRARVPSVRARSGSPPGCSRSASSSPAPPSCRPRCARSPISAPKRWRRLNNRSSGSRWCPRARGITRGRVWWQARC